MKTIVIVPTYNERENIGKLIPDIFKFLPEADVLVVDDSSPDGTADEVRALMGKFPGLSLLLRKEKDGLGRAYVEACTAVLARTPVPDCIITMDADFSHDPKFLPELIEEAEDHALVVGSRYVPGGGTEGWSFFRKILSRGGNAYARLVAGLPVKDSTAGFMCIRASLLKNDDLERLSSFTGYAFMMALKWILLTRGAHVIEVPIIFRERMYGESKISFRIIREGIRAPWRLRTWAVRSKK